MSVMMMGNDVSLVTNSPSSNSAYMFELAFKHTYPSFWEYVHQSKMQWFFYLPAGCVMLGSAIFAVVMQATLIMELIVVCPVLVFLVLAMQLGTHSWKRRQFLKQQKQQQQQQQQLQLQKQQTFDAAIATATTTTAPASALTDRSLPS
ncbi:hypothetical protein BGZ65_008542, partial [Modicella reniformis]